MPLKPRDLKILTKHIEEFAEENPAERLNGAYCPDHYDTLDPSASACDPLNEAISRMVETMLRTVGGANGQTLLRIMKNKETGFTDNEAKAYLFKLFDDQDGLCAITGIRLQLPPNVSDPELVCSLDRIDSNGHYEQDNLQIVCKFVNRWKNNSPNDEFRRLIEIVKSQPY